MISYKKHQSTETSKSKYFILYFKKTRLTAYASMSSSTHSLITISPSQTWYIINKTDTQITLFTPGN